MKANNKYSVDLIVVAKKRSTLKTATVTWGLCLLTMTLICAELETIQVERKKATNIPVRNQSMRKTIHWIQQQLQTVIIYNS
jgi:hypothetical protein